MAATPRGLAQMASWPMSGQNLQNTRFQSAEDRIRPANVSQLKIKWRQQFGPILSTPAVEGDAVYVPDNQGNLYRLDADTGDVVWQVKVIDFLKDKLEASPAQAVSFGTPAVTDTSLIIGVRGPAVVIAVDKEDGSPLWATVVDDFEFANIAQSPIVYRDNVYVGVSSSEEGEATKPDYKCCQFQGSFVALNKRTGKLVGRQQTTPQTPAGYSGNAVWGSTAVIDPDRGLVYITTGDNYTYPESVTQCWAHRHSPSCFDHPDNRFDAVAALDLELKAFHWTHHAQAYDGWTRACAKGNGPPKHCPTPEGSDYDFGQGAALITLENGRQLVGAGQKSGVYWALEPENGRVVWQTAVGPGGTGGGLEWGSATDGNRIYTAIGNSRSEAWTLPNGQTVRKGFWSGLDAATGQIQWQTPDPNPMPTPQSLGNMTRVFWDTAPVSVANGVVYAGSAGLAADGKQPGISMLALDAESGAILWQFESGGTVQYSGAAIANGVVYWGDGSGNMYAFSLP